MKTQVHLFIAFFLSFVLCVCGADGDEYQYDPYLKYRPAFARSLPVQIMLTGVVLTLVAVLFIHLMFTAQYHWPLAPVNYVLQLSGVTTLLISLIATIHVVLSTTFAESEKWPYMLNYIAVNVPPDMETTLESWSVAERATWLVMNASTSGLIQITHIQFLTLLYPSRLEGRLIFALLGPLAIVAAIMQLLPISSTPAVNQLASDVRNVCNATLSLLFTLALFIWGLLVNRRQAWRMDGGTAVFGCAALSLAVVSTALNFLYVHKEEEFVWLPSLMWAVVLWQSFLGWWWWVGAGSNRGNAFGAHGDAMEEDVQETLRRKAKRERRRREKVEKKKERGVRAQRMWRGVQGAFNGAGGVGEEAVTSSAQRRVSASPNVAARRPHGDEHENEYEDDTGSSLTVTMSNANTHTNTNTNTSNSNTTTSTTSTQTQTTTTSALPRVLPRVVHRWYASLRREHNAAARVQAAERVQRMRAAVSGGAGGGIGAGGAGAGMGPGGLGNAGDGDKVDGVRGVRESEPASVIGWGWGWHGFGWRRRAPTGTEEGNGAGKGGAGAGRWFAEKSASRSPSPSDSGSRSRSATRNRTRTGRGRGKGQATTHEYEMQAARHRRRRGAGGAAAISDGEVEEGDGGIYVSGDELEDEMEEEDVDVERGHRWGRGSSRRDAAAPPPPVPQQVVGSGGGHAGNGNGNVDDGSNSIWWWGPLKRWRLQDSTTY